MFTKAELRKQALAHRKNLDAQTSENLSVAIVKRTLEYLHSQENLQVLHVFLPIVKHNEIDTFLLINALRETMPNLQIVVPVSDFTDCSMTSFLLEPHTLLETNRWGIPEPKNVTAIDDRRIDAVIVPLLAFDARGYRVGYGKGFYDRFLQKCRPDVLKIGVSATEVSGEITDAEIHDVRLNVCVSPTKMYFFD